MGEALGCSLWARLMVGQLCMYYVYTLKSRKDGNLYIGCTKDIEKRLKVHNSGGVLSTKSRRPLILVYKELFADKYQAFKAEKFYKTPTGKRKLLSKMKCRIV